jgi:hypothetical protein
VTVNFAADSVYASSNAAVTITVVKASTATVLTVTPSAPSANPTIAFTATVTSPTGTGETGYVSFYSGTSVATGTLMTSLPIGTNGSVTYTTANLTFTNNNFFAVYNESPNPLNAAYAIDGNFTTSTSAVVSPGVDFEITTANTAAIFQGGVANLGVTITPLFGAMGTVATTCSNLPANALCRFQPVSVTLDGKDAVGESVELYTNVSTATAGADVRRITPLTVLLSGLWLAAGGLLLRRRRGFGAMLAVAVIGMVLAASSMTGCSSGSNSTALVTPAGTSTITLNFVATGATTTTHSVNITFTVNSGTF